MEAKCRTENPLPYSNARDELPFSAFYSLARRIAKYSLFAWVMLVLQWNLMSRVNNVSLMVFPRINWRHDHMTVANLKTKKDQLGERCFPKALTANRYRFFLCPISALAIFLSVRSFEEDDELIFKAKDKDHGKTNDTSFTRQLNKFIKSHWEDCERWETKLFGTHSLRKGAATFAALASFGANIFAVLLRGSWSIGDTLSRYFKEAQSTDSYVARLLCGLDPYSEKIMSLPPHFREGEDDEFLMNLVEAQYANCPPLLKHSGSRRCGMFFLASLAHHEDSIRALLPPNHDLFQTAFFQLDTSQRDHVKGLLGPEYAADAYTEGHESIIDPYKIRPTGIPPQTVFFHRVSTKLDRNHTKIEVVESKIDALHGKVEELLTQGIAPITTSNLYSMVSDTIIKALGERAVIQQNADEETQALEVPEPSGSMDSSSMIPTLLRSPFRWPGDLDAARLLPHNFDPPRGGFVLTYKMFHYAFKVGTHVIPALNITKPADWSNKSAKEWRRMTVRTLNFMHKLLSEDETGRTLHASLQAARTYTALQAAVDEGKRRLLSLRPTHHGTRQEYEVTPYSLGKSVKNMRIELESRKAAGVPLWERRNANTVSTHTM